MKPTFTIPYSKATSLLLLFINMSKMPYSFAPLLRC